MPVAWRIVSTFGLVLVLVLGLGLWTLQATRELHAVNAYLLVDAIPAQRAQARLTTLIPSEADGWHITGINVANGPVSAPTLVKLSNADGTSLITLSPRTGDTYWFILTNGVFDVFPDPKGRRAHLTGKIPQRLAAHGLPWLAGLPHMSFADVLADKSAPLR